MLLLVNGKFAYRHSMDAWAPARLAQLMQHVASRIFCEFIGRKPCFHGHFI